MNQEEHRRPNSNRDRVFRLADGRKLGYVDTGNEETPVVLFAHGSGASHDGYGMSARVTTSGGRLISPARPGFGTSDPRPGRTFAAWASDIAELCDSLGIEQFGVLGVSGGAAYSAAVAHALAERVTAVSLISSGGAEGMASAQGGMAVAQRATWFLANRMPRLLRVLMKTQANQLAKDPQAFAHRMLRSLPEVDRAALSGWSQAEQQRFFVEPLVEVLAQGPDAMVEDLRLLARPWGFDPAEISMPVSLWHGSDDESVPVAVVEHLALSIPGATLNIMEGAGHVSAMVESIDQALSFVLNR